MEKSVFNTNDSDSDSEPGAKRVRKSRTVRGRKREPVNMDSESDDDGCVYLNRVKNMRQEQLQEQLVKTCLETEELQGSTKTPPEQVTVPTNTAPTAVESLLSDGDECSTSRVPDRHPSSPEPASPPPPLSPPPPPDTMTPDNTRSTSRQHDLCFRKLDRIRLINSINAFNSSQSDEVSLDSPSPVVLRDRKMIVKVRSRSGIQRFQLKREDTFHEIFEAMLKHEALEGVENCIMFLRDITVHPYSTPTSINLHIADILDFRILNKDKLDSSKEEEVIIDSDTLSIKVQAKDRTKEIIHIRKDEPLEKLFRQYATRKGLPFEAFTFKFDGEELTGQETPDSLDMEDDECIDVISM